MNRSPAFQFYPDKALAGTLHLSDKAFKAYWRLLWFMWLHSDDYFSIPNQVEAILLGTGLQTRMYQKVWVGEIMNPLRPMFRIEDNRIVCNGLRKEAEKQASISKQRQAAAFAKHLHHQKDAFALRNGCSPSPSPSPSPKKDLKTDSCSEAKTASPHEPSPCPPELVGLELYETDEMLKKAWPKLLVAWRKACPGVDIMAEIAKAHAWEIEHPERRKVRRGAYLGRWLRNAQDKPRQDKLPVESWRDREARELDETLKASRRPFVERK